MQIDGVVFIRESKGLYGLKFSPRIHAHALTRIFQYILKFLLKRLLML